MDSCIDSDKFSQNDLSLFVDSIEAISYMEVMKQERKRQLLPKSLSYGDQKRSPTIASPDELEDESVLEHIEEKNINNSFKMNDQIFNSTYQEIEMDPHQNGAMEKEYCKINAVAKGNHYEEFNTRFEGKPLARKKPANLKIEPTHISTSAVYEEISPIKSKTTPSFFYNSYEEPMGCMQSTKISNIYEPITPVKSKSRAPRSIFASAIYEDISPIKEKSQETNISHTYEEAPECRTPSVMINNSSTIYEQVFPIKSNSGVSLFLDSYEEPLEYMQSTKVLKDSTTTTSHSCGIYEQISPIRIASNSSSMCYNSYEEPVGGHDPTAILDEIYKQTTPVKSKSGAPRSIFSPQRCDEMSPELSPTPRYSISSDSYEEPQNLMEHTCLPSKNPHPLLLSRIYEEISALREKSEGTPATGNYGPPLSLTKKKSSLKKCLMGLVRRKYRLHLTNANSSHNNWCKSNSWLKITEV